MRILGLHIEHLKRLKVVSIEPGNGLVEITGPNEAGKSSLIDGIWYLFCGAATHPPEPIRQGAEKAIIRAAVGDDAPEYIVTREFRLTKKNKTLTTRLLVQTPKGANYPKAQRELAGLLGENNDMAMDPLEFSRMKPKDQFAALRRFAPDADFEGVKKANDADYQERRFINRKIKDLEGMIAGIEIPEKIPERIDIVALKEGIAEAEAHNNEVSKEDDHRSQLARENARCIEHFDAADSRVLELGRQLATAKQYRDEWNERRIKVEKEIEALPDPRPAHDLQPMYAKIGDAHKHNEGVSRLEDRVKAKKEREAQLAEAKSNSEKLTKLMENRVKALREKVAEAKMPVKGLELVPGGVHYNGVPFEQASDAVKLRVGCRLAMSVPRELRIIRIRNGSLLDSKSKKIVAEIAEEFDYQVWVEIVDESREMGFVIEDGEVVREPEGPQAGLELE